MVPTDLRYTKDHEWVRIDGDDATVGITAYAAEQLGDIVFVELPEVGRALEQFAAFGVVESVKAVSDLFAPLSGEVTETNAALGRKPGARQQRPVRRGLDDPPPPDRRGRGRRAARRRRLRRADRGRLSRRCPTVHTRPTTGRGCSRRSASTSVDQLFEDIPVALRASHLDLPDPEPELELAARLSRSRRPQPDRPGLVPRRRRLPPLEPAGGRPAPPPRRVVHGLHAVPARDQPGHAPEHLRVRVAARRAGRPRRRLGLALRRRRGDRRGRPDDLPGDPPRPRPRLARRPPALPADDPRRTSRAASSSRRSRSSPTARPPARPTWPRSSGCSPTPDARSPGSSPAQPDFLGLLEPMPEIGRLAHAAGALFVAVVEPVSLAVLAPPGAYGADIAAGEGQPLGIAPAVRRPVPRDPGLDRRARPPDPRPPRRDDDRPRRPAGVRDDAARARAGHPARQGGQQHLHQPGAPARWPRRSTSRRSGRTGCATSRPSARPGGRARGGPGRGRRRAAPSGPVPQRVRRPRARRARPSIAALLDAGVLAGLVLADAEPDDPTLADGLLVCATEVTTVGRDRPLRAARCPARASATIATSAGAAR